MGSTLRNALVQSGLTSSNAKAVSDLLPDRALAKFEDDALGVAVSGAWTFLEGTDSATSTFTITAGAVGGVGAILTGDAGTGLAADGASIVTGLQWKANMGGLSIFGRIKLSAITTCYAFFGFTDVATFEVPIESAASANTFTTTATDAVGFMFDTRMTTDDWWATGVANNTDATHVDLGMAPVADTYADFRIDIDTSGTAVFSYNGAVVATLVGAVTPTVALTPIFMVGKTSVAASMTGSYDIIRVEALRGAAGATA